MRSETRPDNQALRKPLISDAEMAQLLPGKERMPTQGTDSGFKFRNRFLLAAIIFFVIKLIFFSEQTRISLNVPSHLGPYFQYRGIYVLLGTCVYFFSYFRDWHFERVCLLVCAASFTGLVMDIFNVYSLMQVPMSVQVIALIFLRIACTVALWINAIRADRAPPLPRSF
jgi:hypothetical protein